MRIKKFSAHVMDVFSTMNTDFESMNNLMEDLALGREIFDGDRVISKAEANEKVCEFSRRVLGIDDVNDKKSVHRALRDHGREWFDVIEDVVEVVISVGFKDSEWFQDLVDYRNLAYGDRQDFFVEKESVLSVAKGGVSHHDHIIQRIGGGEPFSVPTQLYVIKVGADINRFILGQEPWDKLVAAIAKAFMNQMQEEVASQIDNVASKLPVTGTQFINTGALTASSKDAFDEIVANVSAANDGAEVIIMGTQLALKKINGIADVDWAANAQKDNMMMLGNIGYYDSTRLVAIQNRFKDRTYTVKTFSDKKILILPIVNDAGGKFVKVVDQGELILEKLERGDYLSDIQTYEAQRRYGVATVIGRQLGIWTLP